MYGRGFCIHPEPAVYSSFKLQVVQCCSIHTQMCTRRKRVGCSTADSCETWTICSRLHGDVSSYGPFLYRGRFCEGRVAAKVSYTWPSAWLLAKPGSLAFKKRAHRGRFSRFNFHVVPRGAPVATRCLWRPCTELGEARSPVSTVGGCPGTECPASGACGDMMARGP